MKRFYAVLFAIAAAAGTAAWAIPYAKMERGYDGIGGEWLLIIAVGVMVYHGLRRMHSQKERRFK
jgi:hypothetical protein